MQTDLRVLSVVLFSVLLDETANAEHDENDPSGDEGERGDPVEDEVEVRVVPVGGRGVVGPGREHVAEDDHGVDGELHDVEVLLLAPAAAQG